MGKVTVYDKIMIENQKDKMWKSENFVYINLHLIEGPEWNSQLAKSSADIIYHM